MLSRCFLLLSCLIVLSSGIFAQTSGAITGTVQDASGAAVVGAKVTILEINKGTSQVFETDESGTYNAPFLVPGTYRITVEAPGFKRSTSPDTVIEIAARQRADVTMQVGQASETVEVTAAPPLVRSESAELGEVIGQGAVQSLPLNGRNFAQLVYLVPGVTPGQQNENLSGSSTFNPRASSNFNALGVF